MDNAIACGMDDLLSDYLPDPSGIHLYFWLHHAGTSLSWTTEHPATVPGAAAPEAAPIFGAAVPADGSPFAAAVGTPQTTPPKEEESNKSGEESNKSGEESDKSEEVFPPIDPDDPNAEFIDFYRSLPRALRRQAEKEKAERERAKLETQHSAAPTQDRESQEIFFEHISCPVFLFNFYVNEETGKIFSRSSISWHTHTDPESP
jgi:hypothetical protein